ncbi:cilia- and flagella-associated protein 58-like [Tachypleus tridentatus]|uniref:cilia- and flagella-associated protein 58-like n=1 Tax=Tachypleus tridentatus TaxID=6853 RepID=UPI003FD0FDCE
MGGGSELVSTADKVGEPIDDDKFQVLEEEFQKVLKNIAGDKKLDKFRSEYEKLHEALYKSHENEKRLMQKCREFNAEIAANGSKVAAALKLSEDDKMTIESLKKELEKAWKLVDGAREKEQRGRETIQMLKVEISNLTKLAEKGSSLHKSDKNVTELLQVKEKLIQEKNNLLSEIVQQRKQTTELSQNYSALEKELNERELTVQELQQNIQLMNTEIQREQRKQERAERDLRQAKEEIEAKETEKRDLEQQVIKGKETLSKLENQVKELMQSQDTAKTELEDLNTKLEKMHLEHQIQQKTNEQLTSDNNQKSVLIKNKEEEINYLKQDITRLTKQKEAAKKKLKGIEELKVEMDGQREVLKSLVTSLEKELENSNKQVEQNKRTIEDLIREKELLNKNLQKAAGDTQKQINVLKLHEQAKKTLEHEVQNYREEATKQRKILFQLEKERDRYINEARESTEKVISLMEELKLCENNMFDYKKQIADTESQLKQQQNLYKAVKTDRNLYSISLVEAQDEITELHKKLKILSHQLEQLKEEAGSQEVALSKQQTDLQRVERERDQSQEELQQQQQLVIDIKSQLKHQENEMHKLHQIITEADQEKLHLKKDLDQVISERDVLGTQLVRRNDELALLYEKLRIQQSTLDRGEQQYKQRLDDIRLLKLEIRRLRRERGNLNRYTSSIDEVRHQLIQSEKELLRERTRCKALEEELNHPLNIHRWRQLEGSDPGKYELIQKIQALQKRLISKTQEVVEKETQLHEKDRLYLELKHALSRHPGPEVVQQLQQSHNQLREKNCKLKSMASELNMYESKIAQNKLEMERLTKELADVKKKYLKQKQKEQQTREREDSSHSVKRGGPKYLGGGFKIQTSTHMAS